MDQSPRLKGDETTRVKSIMTWEAVMKQRVLCSTTALSTRARVSGPMRLKDLDSLTCYIREHIEMDLRLPGFRNSSKKFEMGAPASEAAVRRRMEHEGALLEEWLDTMLKYAGLPFDFLDGKLTEVDTQDKGLQEYGLSRIQLLSLGLSQVEIQHAYRMLYVYTIGCVDMLKELCVHCLQKSHLVGCFWQCYIILCEEQTKIIFKAEVAELLKEKQQAVDELKVTRACLNEALDGLSLESLKLLSIVESSKQEVAMIETRKKEVADAKEQVKEAEQQVASFRQQYANLTREHQQTKAQLQEATKMIERLAAIHRKSYIQIVEMGGIGKEEDGDEDEDEDEGKEEGKEDELTVLRKRAAQLQQAVAEERAHVQRANSYNAKLIENLANEKKERASLDKKVAELEIERAKLHQEGEEKIDKTERLENRLHRLENELSVLTEAKSVQSGALFDLRQQLDHVVERMGKLQEQLKEKTLICEQTTKDLQLTQGEVEEWIRGHEKLLADHDLRFLEQDALSTEIANLRSTLGEERTENVKERMTAGAVIADCRETMRVLTFGLAVLATTPPRMFRPSRKESRDSSFMLPAVKPPGSTVASDSGSLIPAALQTSFKNMKSTMADLLQPTQAELAERTSRKQFTKGGMKETTEGAVTERTTNMKLLKGGMKELRDKNDWLANQARTALEQVPKLNAELDDVKERLANVAREKRSNANNLRLAEEEIALLRAERVRLEDSVNDLQKERVRLREALAIEIAKNKKSEEVLTIMARDIEMRAILEEEISAKIVRLAQIEIENAELQTKLGDVTLEKGKLETTAEELVKANGSLLAEIKTLENAVRKGMEVGVRFTEEVQSKLLLENSLKEVQLQLQEVEAQLATLDLLKDEKKQLENDVIHLQAQFTAAKASVASLEDEKSKEEGIRLVLQKEIDKERLLLQTLKRESAEKDAMLQNLKEVKEA